MNIKLLGVGPVHEMRSDRSWLEDYIGAPRSPWRSWLSLWVKWETGAIEGFLRKDWRDLSSKAHPGYWLRLDRGRQLKGQGDRVRRDGSDYDVGAKTRVVAGKVLGSGQTEPRLRGLAGPADELEVGVRWREELEVRQLEDLGTERWEGWSGPWLTLCFFVSRSQWETSGRWGLVSWVL